MAECLNFTKTELLNFKEIHLEMICFPRKVLTSSKFIESNNQQFKRMLKLVNSEPGLDSCLYCRILAIL